MAKTDSLREISPDNIIRNPENPRVFFREVEMQPLQQSIRQLGIQVPLSVYANGDGTYTLIDGERRWRCALKLNLPRVPAIVQQKPTELDNLLMMFNIHMLREQWDYFTIANKLPRVIALFKEKHSREPVEHELSDATGLTRGQIRRCRYLLKLPEQYKNQLVSELDLPKAKQRLSEDFFIEMERALTTVQARLPEAITDVDATRDVLISKYRSHVIDNVTDFRQLSKMATAVEGLGVSRQKARSALRQIFTANKVDIATVYTEQFEFQYDVRKITLHCNSLIEFLQTLESSNASLNPELRKLLIQVCRLVGEIVD